MSGKPVIEGLNAQIVKEFASAFNHLATAGYCDSINLPGFSAWCRRQHARCFDSALKIFDFVHDIGGEIRLKGFQKPDVSFGSIQQVFEDAVDHERTITESYNSLHDLALKAGDKAVQRILQPFIEQQVTEEKEVYRLAQTLKMIGDEGFAVIMLDRELGPENM